MNRTTFFMSLAFVIAFLAAMAQRKAKSGITALDKCEKCLLLTEQAENRLLIVKPDSREVLWEFKPAQSNIAPEHIAWFTHISEAKAVYNKKFVLTTASAGAVALIRIADKKVVFYANAGNNTHSAEVLSDGNIVSVTSTGNQLTVYKVDTVGLHTGYRKTYFIKDGHNAVWDNKRQQLWATAGDTLKIFKYNHNCKQPELIQSAQVMLPGHGPHDLFPVYGKDMLWFTDVSHIYQFNVSAQKFTQYPISIQKDIKSISSGAKGYPTIIMKPQEQWWSDEVLDENGKSIYQQKGLKIYKARWFVDNQFSYPKRHIFSVCK